MLGLHRKPSYFVVPLMVQGPWWYYCVHSIPSQLPWVFITELQLIQHSGYTFVSPSAPARYPLLLGGEKQSKLSDLPKVTNIFAWFAFCCFELLVMAWYFLHMFSSMILQMTTTMIMTRKRVKVKVSWIYVPVTCYSLFRIDLLFDIFLMEVQNCKNIFTSWLIHESISDTHFQLFVAWFSAFFLHGKPQNIEATFWNIMWRIPSISKSC